MKIYAVITSMLIASSSVAVADHDAYKNNDRLEDRFDARGEFARRMPTRLVWAPLSQMITANRTNAIKVDDCHDELRAIRLQNGEGATYIYGVTLVFEDGTREQVSVGKWLYWDVPTLTVDLPHRRTGVERITFHTWTWFRSTYQVFGQRMEHPPVVPPLPQPLPPPPLPGGIVIGKDLTFANTAGYVQLPVGAEKGSFGKLRIEATGAVTFIGRIYVKFPTGAYQTLDVNKPLYRGESLSLDLTGGRHPISAVTVMAGDDLHAVGNAARFTVSLF